MSTDLGSESSEKFHCIICDYYTSRKSQFVRHNLTDKHKNQQLSTVFTSIHLSKGGAKQMRSETPNVALKRLKKVRYTCE